MFEIITESNKKEYYNRLYIDTKLFKTQRITSAVVGGFIGLLAGVGAYVSMSGGILAIIVALLLVLVGAYGGWKFKYIALRNAVKEQNAQLDMMFPEFLQTFIALLEANPTNNITSVLETSIPYLKQPIRQQVLKIVNSVYEDGTNENVRQSMMTFAEYIGNVEATRIMDIINSMYMSGANPQVLTELDEKVQAMNANKVRVYVEKKSKGLQSLSMPSLVMGIIFIFGFLGVVGSEYLSRAFELM